MKNGFFSKKNYIVLTLGVGMIIVGFIALATRPVEGFWTMKFAPVVLTLAYCVVIPVAIILKPKAKEKE